MKNLDQYILESLKGYKPGAIDTKKHKEQLPQSCENYFANQKVDVDDIENLDTSNVTNMKSMFENTTFSSNSLDLSGWDVSKVTNMAYMFSYIDDLKSLDLSSWDVSNVTDMSFAFGNCKNLEYIDVSNWRTTNLRKIHQLFMFCDKLKTIDGISDLDVSKITRLDGIFRYCSSLESLDLSTWDVSNLIHMKNIFEECRRLEYIDLSGWDVSNVIDDNIYIFCNCYSLTNIIFGPGWGKSNADNIKFILYDCGEDKGYKLSDETYESMLTMYDRKKAGLSPMEITFNRRHNIPDGFKKQMEARGYIIELK